MPIRYRVFCLLVIVALLTGNAMPVQAQPAPVPLAQAGDGTVITPSSINHTFSAGTGFEEPLAVTTAKTPVPKLDVLFVFDVTGSMRDVINAAKDRGTFIMNTVRAKVPDTAFGVASFADYPGTFNYAGYAGTYGGPGDYPWQLDQPVTADIALAQQAINHLVLHNGEDGPEDYSRALFESILANWRPGAKRVVVLFGDAVAHDTIFYSRNYGADPGPDATMGTGDDLIFTDVVANVAEIPITIIPINSDLRGNADVQKGFQYIADQTGGQVFPIAKGDQAPDAVVRGLTEASAVIHRLSVEPSTEMPSWVTIAPDSFADVGGSESRSFGLNYDVPAAVTPGVYEFTLTVSADGATLGVVPVKLTIGSQPLDAAKLATTKQKLIQFLSAPSGGIKIFDVAVPYQAATTYKAPEDDVAKYLASLNVKSPEPAMVGGLSYLTAQETALKDLWLVHVDSAGIVGKHATNVVLVGLSALSFFDFLKRPDIVAKISGFGTKILNEAEKKVSEAISEFLLYIVSQFPNQKSQAVQDLKIVIHALPASVEGALAKDPTKGLQDILVEGLGPVLVVSAMNKSYVEQTQGYVADGLNRAQTYAQQAITLDQASANAAITEAHIRGTTAEAQDRLVVVQEEATRIEGVQAANKMVTQAADLTALAATASGVGGVIGLVAKALSILSRALDAGASTYVIYDAAELWSGLPAAAGQATATGTSAGVTMPAPPKGVVLIAWPMSKPGLLANNLIVPRSSSKKTPPTIHFAEPLESTLAQSSSDFKALLAELDAAVRAGDTQKTQAVAEEILTADDTLSGNLRSSRSPALAAASDPSLATDLAWRTAYTTIGTTSADYSMSGATFYLYLFAYLAEPANAQSQAALLDSISSLNQAVDKSVAAVNTILPMAEGHVAEPIVAVTNVTYPDNLSVGQTFEVVVSLANPIPIEANDVSTTLVSQGGIQLVSSANARVASLAPAGTAQLKFKVRLTQSAGDAVIETAASNGLGQSYSLHLLAASTTTPAGGGFGVVLIIGVVAIGGVLIFASQKRRRPGSTHRATGVVLPKAALWLIGNTGVGTAVPIQSDHFTIGRGSANNYSLADPQVSRRHAIIRYAGGRWFLQDQNSALGTFVNGQRVNATALNNGDRIRIGTTEFEFRIG